MRDMLINLLVGSLIIIILVMIMMVSNVRAGEVINNQRIILTDPIGKTNRNVQLNVNGSINIITVVGEVYINNSYSTNGMKGWVVAKPHMNNIRYNTWIKTVGATSSITLKCNTGTLITISGRSQCVYLKTIIMDIPPRTKLQRLKRKLSKADNDNIYNGNATAVAGVRGGDVHSDSIKELSRELYWEY
jgi:hypothetical protein